MFYRITHSFQYNQRGVSLVGVTVIAGIGLLVIGGMTSMITDVFKAQKAAQAKEANRELTASISQILIDPVACNYTFGGLGTYVATTDTHSKTVIKDKNNNTVYDTNTNYLNGLVKFTDFEVTNYNASTGQADLNIKASKVGATVGGAQMLSTIKLKLTLNGSNNISGCMSIGGSGTTYWHSLNGADIYYNGGNVGVGTTNPGQKLEVNGGIALNTITTKPTCNATTRGTVWFSKNGVGVKDTFEVCAKDAAEVYSWITGIGGGGGGLMTAATRQATFGSKRTIEVTVGAGLNGATNGCGAAYTGTMTGYCLVNAAGTSATFVRTGGFDPQGTYQTNAGFPSCGDLATEGVRVSACSGGISPNMVIATW